MKPTRRNSDTRIRALERTVLSGDLTAVVELARAYERVGRGEPLFSIKEQTRRLVADVERVEETGEAGSIRDVLTELTHLTRERGLSITGLLEAAQDVADEEEQGMPCPDCGRARTPEERGVGADRCAHESHNEAVTVTFTDDDGNDVSENDIADDLDSALGSSGRAFVNGSDGARYFVNVSVSFFLT